MRITGLLATHPVLKKRLLFTPRQLQRSISGGSSQKTRRSERRTVDIPTATIFETVLDVDSYKDFLPFCTNSRVTTSVRQGCFEADLAIGFKSVNASYTSRVSFERGSESEAISSESPNVVPWRIDAVSVGSTLLNTMDCHWVFHPLEGGNRTDIDFAISFEVAGGSWVIQSVLDTVFEDVANSQVSAFEERCREILAESRKNKLLACDINGGGPLSAGLFATGGPVTGRILER
mmetsp:Transcript_3002/g.6033  ORF Transcript_3002/g.6033 Transcript_3002/m.6033 type:complete len:234 (-) Transcript_3002:232-933(-)